MEHRIEFKIDIKPARFCLLRREAHVDLKAPIGRVVDPPRRPRTACCEQHHHGHRKGTTVVRSSPWRTGRALQPYPITVLAYLLEIEPVDTTGPFDLVQT